MANHLAAPINFPEKRNGIRTCQLQKKVLQLLSRTQGGLGKIGYYTPLAKGNLHHLQLTVSDMIGYTSSFSIEDVVLVKKHIDEGLQDHGSTTWQLIQGHGTCLPQEGRGMPPRQKRGSEECFLALTEAHDRLVICSVTASTKISRRKLGSRVYLTARFKKLFFATHLFPWG